MSAGRQIVVAPSAGGEYESDPLDAELVIEGSPETSDRPIGGWSDGTLTGMWRCEPGRFRDLEVDESFVVLEGRATIEHQGSAYEVGPGDVCVLPAGAETVWTVHETLLKVYVLQPPSP